MRRFEHGGNIREHPGAHDFSASLNPLGMTQRARDALRSCVDACEAYPDPECAALVEAIARYEGAPQERVLACAGATDAITRVCLATRPRRGLVCSPSYSGYEQALLQAGADVFHHMLGEADGFALTESLLDDIASEPDLDIAFVGNPNNPTGLVCDRALIEKIAAATAERDVVLVLDESFVEFTDAESAVGMIARFPNLVIVKSFTKLYAMAGIRLGYMLCADCGIVRACMAAGQPWAVSTPAQACGIAVLEDAGFAERTRVFVAARRAELESGLRALGLHVIPGRANFLLFQSPQPIYEPLLGRGIVVRRCENFAGLDDRWYRVAVRTAEENAILLGALAEILGAGAGESSGQVGKDDMAGERGAPSPVGELPVSSRLSGRERS